MEDDSDLSPRLPTRFRSITDYENKSSICAALTEFDYHQDAAPSMIQVEHCIMDSNLNSFCCDWQVKLDLSTSYPQSIEDEARRLMELKEYAILDSGQEEKFERITALASRIFEVPICLVSLVDIGRQWFMSNRGLGDVRETSRNSSFCAHAILSKQEVFVVSDTREDPRFRDNPLVTSSPYIRFYAGAPLVTPAGYKIGTLCIIDPRPRRGGLGLNEKQNLRELAEIVVDILVHRKQEMERLVDEKTRIIACAAHDLLSPLTGMRLNLGLLIDDETLGEKLDDSQKELMDAAVKCSDMIERICVRAIETFRGGLCRVLETIQLEGNESGGENGGKMDAREKDYVNINLLVDYIERVVGTFPKKVPFIIQKDDNVPEAIISDDLKLFRSILNYITNACKHTISGSILLRIYVRKAAEAATEMEFGLIPGALFAPKRDSFIMEVHDTGPGIALEKYPTLFTPHAVKPLHMDFHQSRMTNSGLGLYSVATEIGSLGGEFGVFPRQDLVSSLLDNDSEGLDSIADFEPEVTGSVFWLSIPLVLPEQEHVTSWKQPTDQPLMPIPDAVPKNLLSVVITEEGEAGEDGSLSNATFDQLPRQSPPANIFATSAKKKSASLVASTTSALTDETTSRSKVVLIIDDSVSIRKGLMRALSRLGFEVDEAENGMQGFKMLKNRMYDFVIVDFLMPVMDGPDVVQKFRGWEKDHRPDFHQYIIGISAHANGKDSDLGLKAGMDRFMGKPVPLKALKDLSQCKEVTQASIVLDSKHKKAFDDINAALCVSENRTASKSGSKSLQGSSVSSGTFATQCCLIVAEEAEPALLLTKHIAEKSGWRVVVETHGDGESALRLLKMRNWDAAFIDNDLSKFSGTICLVRFREWEQRVRSVQQRNIFIMSDTCSGITLPTGFDGVLMKPLNPNQLVNIFEASSFKFNGHVIDVLNKI